MNRLLVFLAVVLACSISIICQGRQKNEKHAELIVVEKQKRLMTLYYANEPFRTYRIALGHNPIGHKLQVGDGRTPEGTYRICGRNRQSRYHRSLRISYPGPEDLARARELGVDPGGDIMIHGIAERLAWVGDRHQLFDWTNGCIAVTNKEIEEIWSLVPTGTTIEIRP